MTRKMIINAGDPDEIRIAILNNDGRLEEFDIEARGFEKNKGNIYKGVVRAVEPALNAAFVDYGADKQGFLTGPDVNPKCSGPDKEEKHYRISDLLRPKQEIVVQIAKDEVSQKGAVLTTYLSLAGRYTVIMPGSGRRGVSRKVEDEETRRKMREASARLPLPEDMGIIVRTAGKDRSKADLARDVKRLLRLWKTIEDRAARGKAPALLFKEQDVVIRALRDYLGGEIDEVILDSDDAYDRAADYMRAVMPRQQGLLTRYVERRPIFHYYRIEEQIEALYSSRVDLPSGGSLVIDPTEALVAIDVNSGKQRLGGQEETALETNLEAAVEVARQLRLRNLGGIIVVDFIDMVSPKHQQRVLRCLRDAVKRDRARIRLGRFSPNGTMELTRQRLTSALDVSCFRTCVLCNGTGRTLMPLAHAVQVLRKLRDAVARGNLLSAVARVEPEAARHLLSEKWTTIEEIEQSSAARITVTPDATLHPGMDDFTFEIDQEATVIPAQEPYLGPAVRFGDEFESDEEDEEEDEYMSQAHSNQDGTTARSSKRRRRKGRRRKGFGDLVTVTEAEEANSVVDLGLPTFEFIDPREIAPKQRQAQRPSEGTDTGTRGESRRRRRPRRKPGQSAQPRPQAPEPRTPAPSSDTPEKKKPSFLAKLFGWAKKSET